jgi:hypothetical protein
VFNYITYIEPNSKIIGIGEFGRIWMEAVLPYCRAVAQYFYGGIEEDSERSKSV